MIALQLARSKCGWPVITVRTVLLALCLLLVHVVCMHACVLFCSSCTYLACLHCFSCVHVFAAPVHTLHVYIVYHVYMFLQIRQKRYRDFGRTMFGDVHEERRPYARAQKPRDTLGDASSQEPGRDRTKQASTNRRRSPVAKVQLPATSKTDGTQSTSDDSVDDFDVQDPSDDDVDVNDCDNEEKKSIAPRERATIQHNAFLRLRPVLEDGIATLENQWQGGCTVWSIAKQELCKVDAPFRFVSSSCMCTLMYTSTYTCMYTYMYTFPYTCLYVHICVHTLVCRCMFMYMRVHTHVHTYVAYVHVRVYMHSYMCVYMYVHMCSYTHFDISVHTCVCMDHVYACHVCLCVHIICPCTFMYIHMYTHMLYMYTYVCTCIHTCMCIRMYTCMYTVCTRVCTHTFIYLYILVDVWIMCIRVLYTRVYI